ncbi:MAG TPA: AI-2E family transporter [Acidimicrobiales bacterium]|jgi:predicted PurR-regulated permease PerM
MHPFPPPVRRTPPGQVPVRTILATIGLVLLTLAGLALLRELARIIAWVVVAGFFAVVLTPAVDLLEHRARIRRGIGTTLVFLTGLALLVGLMYAFIRPIVDQVQEFVDDLPGYVEDAQNGQGWIGELVERYNLQDYVEENQDRLRETVTGLGTPALGFVRTVFSTLLAFLTIVVLTFLMLLEGPGLTAGITAAIPERHRDRVRAVAADAARAVSGYMLGNLLISVVAGTASYIFLRIAGVPYAEVLALYVAFTDLIPLVGATLGAVPTTGVAFLYSVPAGVATAIFFIVYQQFENHVLQVSVMSRTVAVNPLFVLVSALAGVELFGLLGALLAIPAAGVIQVIVRDLWDHRSGGPKQQPTIGADEVPADVSDDGAHEAAREV